MAKITYLGLIFHGHLEKDGNTMPFNKVGHRKKMIFQLCSLLWKLVEPNMFGTLRAFKTCNSLWKKAMGINFSNDIQGIYVSAHKLTSLKQTDHDMTFFIVEAQSAVEELKIIFEVDSLEEIRKKLNMFYMATILLATHLDFDHVQNQIMTGKEILSMDTLTAQLLRVLTLTTRDMHDSIKSFFMVSTVKRGGCGN